MLVEVDEHQMELVIGSLYFANCRLGPTHKMDGGKHESRATYLIQILKQQLKKEKSKEGNNAGKE